VLASLLETALGLAVSAVLAKLGIGVGRRQMRACGVLVGCGVVVVIAAAVVIAIWVSRANGAPHPK
jgi:hypothetical protein